MNVGCIVSFATGDSSENNRTADADELNAATGEAAHTSRQQLKPGATQGTKRPSTSSSLSFFLDWSALVNSRPHSKYQQFVEGKIRVRSKEFTPNHQTLRIHLALQLQLCFEIETATSQP